MRQSQTSFSLLNRLLLLAALMLLSLFPTGAIWGQGADLIWSPRHEGDNIPISECYFRKKFTLISPEKGEVQVAADDAFELFVNGQQVERGSNVDAIFDIDVTPYLKPGVNLIAFKVENFHGNEAGLAAKFRVKERNETRWRSLKTDDTWKTRTSEIPTWTSNGYNDIGWLNARVLRQDYLNASATQSSTSTPSSSESARQPVAATPVASRKTTTENEASTINLQSTQAKPASSKETQLAQQQQQTRFQLDPEFRIQQLLSAKQTGSVIAMAFNEFGQLIFSREGGPLMIADLTMSPNDPERVQLLCDRVTSCQGILPLNGDVFVTGDGPSGLGLYRLGGKGLTGQLSVKTTLLRFKGDPGEHGPHGIELGPDGMIYCIVGNQSTIDHNTSNTSPVQHTYDGDLLPRYEDPGGHAQGVRGQGGTVVRVSLDGTQMETVAVGIRNAYDLTFDQWGDLFIHDSDMEADMGMSWYRPTMITHVVPGAELGWRSGWAKFPEYFADTIPPAAKTGRGSPTGSVQYRHMQFPSRFHDAMFFADWSEGRILAAFPRDKGTTKEFDTEVFLKGKPLNVTDLAIGEDGALYFCTGGRGTQGGVFRVFWGGQVPEDMMQFESELAKIIRHPQPNSAWARQNLAKLQAQLKDTWGDDIRGIAEENRNTSEFRVRALDIMVIYGPFPSVELVEKLAVDADERVRAKVASICGLRPGYQNVLRQLVADEKPNVRRHACEAYLRLDQQPDVLDLLTILKSSDRFETTAARRLLERIPVNQWIDDVLTSNDKRIFINGSLAAVTAYPSLERSYQILARSSEIMNDFVSDADFMDMLRVMQLALVQGDVDPDRIPAFVERIKREFPSGSGLINRELARVLSYLKAGDMEGRIGDYLRSSKDSAEDKVHVAMYMQTIGSDLSEPARIALIDSLERAKARSGGGSYKLYIQRAVKEVSETLTANQISTVLENGDKWPTALISAFYKLPQPIGTNDVDTIIALDRRLKSRQDGETEIARLGVIAVLAESNHEKAFAYLRELWQNETKRRADIAIGLAQQPDGKNWAYLVSSLPVLDDMTSVEVLRRLLDVNLRPKTAPFYEQVLKLGYRLGSNGATDAAKLIQHWSGEDAPEVPMGWKARLNYWKQWYEVKFPEGNAVESQPMQKASHNSVSKVMQNLDSLPGDAEAGHAVFTKAQCASCHRYGSYGDSTGPDLTSIASRFSKREIVEAIVEPSKVVPEQYKTKAIMTENGMTLTGYVIEEPEYYTVVQGDGKKMRVSKTAVEAIKDREESAMPNHLLDNLSAQEVSDLFAYMYSSNPDRFSEQATESVTR